MFRSVQRLEFASTILHCLIEAGSDSFIVIRVDVAQPGLQRVGKFMRVVAEHPFEDRRQVQFV